MSKYSPAVIQANEILKKGKKLGIAQLIVEDQQISGSEITVNGNKIINFGSCSYLGLEQDERLKAAAIKAIQDYGTQFSSSRTYLSIKLYEELEHLLEQIFGYPSIAAPTTSLGHISNIPLLVSKDDVVILDHQVHASVQSAVNLVKAKGTKVELMRHSNMDYLENRIKKLKDKHQKIWYMADGVYSMYGDGAPLHDIYDLLNRYDQFHLYIDDAHGMSWTGKNGKGFVLNQIPYHPKMVLITSLNKSFAAGGSAMIYYNNEIKSLVRNCGSTLMFSGPMQPSQLGAAIASAKIHLSPEITNLQDQLLVKIKHFIKRANELNLPLVNHELTPIFFIGVGKPDIGYTLCKQLIDLGFYNSLAVYPSVPYNNTGLRLTITNNHSFQEIDELLSTLSIMLNRILEEEKYDKQKIFKAFKMKASKSSN